MEEIKQGDFAIVRTTGEPVFVLSVRTLDGNAILLPGDTEVGGFKTQVKVRRPLSGRNGIMHVEEWFYAEELESEKTSAKRRYQNALELQAELANAEIEQLPELEVGAFN